MDAARRCTAWRAATLSTGDVTTVVAAIRSAVHVTEGDLPNDFLPFWPAVRGAAERLASTYGNELRAGEIQLVRYPEGGFFLLHQDASAHPREWRKVSVVAYLNDDFEGGETHFPNHGVVARPRAGYALTFAPHYPHRAGAVVSGEKFILAFWLGRD